MHGRVVRTGATAHPRAVRAAMRGQRAACADWTSDSQPSWTALQRLRAAGGTVPRRAFVNSGASALNLALARIRSRISFCPLTRFPPSLFRSS